MKAFRLFLILFILSSYSAFAQSQESKIQALFVLKFVENVSWPQDRKDIVIGVVGKTEILTELENRLKAKNPNGLVIKKISAQEANTCDVVARGLRLGFPHRKVRGAERREAHLGPRVRGGAESHDVRQQRHGTIVAVFGAV